MPYRRSSFLAVLLGVLPLAAIAQGIAPRATVLVASVDLGMVTPGADELMATEQIVPVRVVSSKYWQLGIERHAQGTATSAASVDDWSINVGGAWQPLRPGVRVVIATGQANGPEGTLVNAQLRFKPSFTMAPGRRRDLFDFELDGFRADAPLRIEMTIPPTVVLEDDHGAFSVVADRPSEHSEYDFNPRVFIVRSNTRWIVEVVEDTLAEEKSYSIEVLDPLSVYLPLRQSVIVAAGQPTGTTPAEVTVKMKLKLGPTNVAGTYARNIGVRARVAESTQ